MQESPFLRVKGIVIFLHGLRRGREAPHRRQWVVHHAPQNPCLSFIKVKITNNIRDKDVDNNVEDEAVNYKHNRCGWSSMPHRTMSLYEEVNNCVEDLGGGADDGDNHKHANDH